LGGPDGWRKRGVLEEGDRGQCRLNKGGGSCCETAAAEKRLRSKGHEKRLLALGKTHNGGEKQSFRKKSGIAFSHDGISPKPNLGRGKGVGRPLPISIY